MLGAWLGQARTVAAANGMIVRNLILVQLPNVERQPSRLPRRCDERVRFTLLLGGMFASVLWLLIPYGLSPRRAPLETSLQWKGWVVYRVAS